MKSPVLPSKILILLAGASLLWIAVISLACMGFMALIGGSVSGAWICAGALLFALAVWTIVMAGEFRSAIAQTVSAAGDDQSDADGPTSPLPLHARRTTGFRGLWSGRRFLPFHSRRKTRRGNRSARPLAKP